MKRSMTIAVGFLLIIAMLSLLAGCGSGDTAKAKEYMQEGDRMVSEIESGIEDLLADMSETFYQVSDTETFMEAVDEIKDTTAGLGDAADEALAEYKKIDGLEGVQDYKDYAELETEAGKIFKEMLQSIDAFLDDMAEVVESGITDEAAINEIAQSFQAEMAEIGSMMDEIEKEAEELKEEKNL